MSMADHYPLLPFLSTRLPPFITARASRQIGKSSIEAAGMLIRSASRPGHKSLVVLPLREQADRLSDQVFRPMIEDSPIKYLLRDDTKAAPGSVRRRSFLNRAVINFGYAGLTAGRLRGIAARELDFDESQGIDPHHMPVVRECQSSFTDPMTFFYGTSTTLDTLLEQNWEKSSQGVWCVKCGCGYDNQAIVEDGDALKMIGPIRDDVSESRPGTVCAKCSRFVNPRLGRWVHRRPERLKDHAGYNLPQIIFPTHFAYPEKWATLVRKMQGKIVGYNYASFLNEVMGAAYELSVRLLSRAEIQKAAVLGPNTLEAALARAYRAELVVVGVDWGGGGVDGGSLTRLAVCVFSSDGGIDVVYGLTMPFGLDAVEEAREVFRVATLFRAAFIAHDYNGAGASRESIITHLDWPVDSIAPIVYHAMPGSKILSYRPAEGQRYRGFYHQMKPVSLQFMANAARFGKLRFFKYDYIDEDEPGLLNDFNNYVENRMTAPSGKSIYQVRAATETATTDFADAVNMGAAVAWEFMKAWPSLKT